MRKNSLQKQSNKRKKRVNYIGFTHYTKQKKELDKATFKKFAKGVKKIIKASPVKVQFECDDESAPITSGDQIRFNGIGELGHETFVINREMNEKTCGYIQTMEDGLIFNFCKTARKPYDMVAVASLILLKLYFRDDVKISSDGDISDWAKGLALLNEALGLDVKMVGEDNGDVDDSIRLQDWDEKFPKEVVSD